VLRGGRSRTGGRIRTYALFYAGNVCFEGETIKVDVVADNSNGTTDLNGVIVKLVQYTFISANNGVSRTYKKVIHEHKVSRTVGKGQKRDMDYKLTVPTVNHQTAISTLVANYFRIEVVADMGTLTSEIPSIYAPIFVLKKSFNFKKPNSSKVHPNFRSYTTSKPVIFRAPEYWFRKNKNLSVMNFKLEDLIEGMVGMTEIIN
jgi:hypothetical protein